MDSGRGQRTGTVSGSWLVTGSRGQLGRALTERLDAAGLRCRAFSHEELDIASEDGLRAAFDALEVPPAVLLNAAAFTHVDRCEREPERAWAVNAVAPGLLARICSERGVRFVHVSTDYVFSGDASQPYVEEEVVAPASNYGRSKLEGERRVLALSGDFLVVRSSWIFGGGRNFLVSVLGQAAKRRSGEVKEALRVVDDQWGRPSYAVDLAAGILALLEAGARGLYHLANAGVATWWELARFCLDESGYRDVEIERVPTAVFERPAPRPRWSVLDCGKASALGIEMRDWRDAVRDYLLSEGGPMGALGPPR